MRLRLALTLSAVLVSLGSTAAYAEGDGALISGLVRNGTRGASVDSVSGLKVAISSIDRGGSQAVAATTRTDGSGSFAVEDFEQLPGRQFMAWVEYGGVVYRSDAGSIPAGSRRLDLVVDIFEAEENATELEVALAHTVVELQRDHLFVTQLLAVDNPSDRTKLGTAPSPSGSQVRKPASVAVGPQGASSAPRAASASSFPSRQVLRIPLPREVSEVRFQDEALSSLSRVAEGSLEIGRPLPPGRSQIIFSYLLPRQMDSAQFAVAFPYGASRATLLIPDVGLSATVEGLREAGTLQTEDQRRRYLSFTGEQLAAGRTATVRLSAIPAAPSSAAPTVSPPDEPPSWAWTVLGLGLAALALAVASLLRVRKSPQVKP